MGKRSPRERANAPHKPVQKTATKPIPAPKPGAKAAPSKGGKPKRKYVLRVAAGIVRQPGSGEPLILITRRREGDTLAGYWEFPGGKLEPGEDYPEALQRELREEIGVETEIGTLFHTISQDYPKKILRIRFYNAAITGGELAAREVAEWKWVRSSDLGNFRFPPADRPLIKKLQFSSPEKEQSQ